MSCFDDEAWEWCSSRGGRSTGFVSARTEDRRPKTITRTPLPTTQLFGPHSRYVFSDTIVTRFVPPVYGDSSGVRGAAWLWPAESVVE